MQSLPSPPIFPAVAQTRERLARRPGGDGSLPSGGTKLQGLGLTLKAAPSKRGRSGWESLRPCQFILPRSLTREPGVSAGGPVSKTGEGANFRGPSLVRRMPTYRVGGRGAIPRVPSIRPSTPKAERPRYKGVVWWFVSTLGHQINHGSRLE